MLSNRHNWQALPRALWVFSNPVEIFWHVLRGTCPPSIKLRSPTGPVMISLRNNESLKTCFSIFAREDYRTPAKESWAVLDIGANIGIAALYFLSRNRSNRVQCFEPDQANLEFLRRNIGRFAARVEIVEKAVAPSGGTGTLYRAIDGKHSSLLREVAVSNGFDSETDAELISFDGLLREAVKGQASLLVKMDVEGIEADLVRSVDFLNYPKVRRVLIESTVCSALIARPHQRTLRAGSIEDIRFA